MKLSEIKKEDIAALSEGQIESIVFGGEKFYDPTAEVALLLGTLPEKAVPRALAAAELYLASKVKYVVPSGGVEWEYEGELVSEAEIMRRVLLERGVPQEAIILENEARTTKENMIYGSLQINRNINFYNVSRVCIVTSPSHLRRGIELARVFLPRCVEVVGYAADHIEGLETVRREVPLLKSLVDNRMIDDIIF